MNVTTKWNYIHRGDIIDVVAPGSGSSNQIIKTVIHFLDDLGLQPRVPTDLLGPELLSSNSDDVRARHLITALHDVHSKAVWCLRNGYGAYRIMPFIAKINKPLRSKVFIGGPDSTGIHLLLNQTWNWPTIYGPTLERAGTINMAKKDLEEFFQIIRGKKTEVIFDGLKPLNAAAKVSNTVTSTLIGGHLSYLSLSIGTPWQIQASNNILFIDESNSRAHRVDGLLEHLVQSSFLNNFRAIIFGSFVNCNEPDGKVLTPGILERFAQPLQIPVFTNLKNVPTNSIKAIPFGTEAILTTGNPGRIIIAGGGSGETTSSSIKVA